MSKKLNKKQIWILNYLKENSDYANGKAVEYVSPTEIGRAYGESIGKKGYHSSSASPTLIVLTEYGLILRNYRGHYKLNRNFSETKWDDFYLENEQKVVELNHYRIYTTEMKKINQLPQTQFSLSKQCEILRIFANKLGLYDASDLLKNYI